MPYIVKEFRDLPVPAVLAQMVEPFDQSHDTLDSVNESDDLLSRIEGDKVFMIVDLSQLKMDLGSLMQGFAAAFLPHDDLRTSNVFADRVSLLMVGSGALLKLAVKAAGQDQYGNRKIELFETLDEALTFIRQAEAAQP